MESFVGIFFIVFETEGKEIDNNNPEGQSQVDEFLNGMFFRRSMSVDYFHQSDSFLDLRNTPLHCEFPFQPAKPPKMKIMKCKWSNLHPLQ